MLKMRLDWDDDFDLDRNCKIWVLTGRLGPRLEIVTFDHQPSRAEMVGAEEMVRERLK
jgi:hypothetical protein